MNKLKISWVIPDFAVGAGGHMTIFRIASMLQSFGHSNTLYVYNQTHHADGDAALRTINNHFIPFSGDVKILGSELPISTGDALIATDRFSCYPVNAMAGYVRKFYFVQDYEPLFYPAGAESLLSEATYKFDFDCLCAGEWLDGLMKSKFNRWSMAWPLAYEKKDYNLSTDTKRLPRRIAFYARYATPRRAVELGFMALDLLKGRGINFEVDFFGQDLGNLQVSYPHKNHGILKSSELGALYQRSTIGVVFSATNHSLVNKEMMACGLPVIDLNLENVRSVFNDKCMLFAEPTPEGIADAIERLLYNEQLQEEIRLGGLEFIDGLSWELSARKVETALLNRVNHFRRLESNNA